VDNDGRIGKRASTNLQLLAVLLEDPCRAEQHCGVRVVAAGVHLPGLLALVVPLHFFLFFIKISQYSYF
jgi:hypothetical protein